jgi:hypothetical protein
MTIGVPFSDTVYNQCVPIVGVQFLCIQRGCSIITYLLWTYNYYVSIVDTQLLFTYPRCAIIAYPLWVYNCCVLIVGENCVPMMDVHLVCTELKH